jgi:CRISPR system Cascade subunit CasA
MNLLLDDWIAVRRRSGLTEKIAPVRLTAGGDDPAVEIEAPRADFRGALYQFLIGVLQTAMAPRDLREWCQRWETPPSEQELQKAFAPFAQAFELDSAGPAFMQDFDSLNDVEPRPIERLLIDGPSENALTNNLDHFNHRGIVPGVCFPCAASALYTYQINAPEGGPGFRVSVRGGGPLTTLLMPEDLATNLWRKAWINVLPSEALDSLRYSEIKSFADVFPWTQPTRTSEPGGLGDTTPEMVHRLQAYWSMSQRIKLVFTEEIGTCDLCGQSAERLVRNYRTKNYGVNYTGAWLHPLSPYNYDAKGEKPPLAVKGQKGGIGYRHWLGLTLGNKEQAPDAALVVKHFMQRQERLPEAARRMRLWCFGFNMKQAKARCWYDSTLPVYLLANDSQKERFAEAVGNLLDVAKEAASALHTFLKQARPKDRGNEPAEPQSFWQRSEKEFYRMLKQLADADLEQEDMLMPFYRDWLIAIEKKALELFDEWVLAAPIEEMNMKRVVEARTGLLRQLKTKGAAKRLWKAVREFEEAKA